MTGSDADPLEKWAADQRALAKALGMTIEEWLAELDRAGERRTGLTAAVVGAAVAQGLGLSVLDRLDGPALARSARERIDPEPPRVESPLLKEAIRRAQDTEVPAGAGAARLRGKRAKEPLPTPMRNPEPLGPSATERTADAPGIHGEDEPDGVDEGDV